MRHFLTLLDERPEDLRALVALARTIKAGVVAPDPVAALRGRILGMLFFNPSLRTRASFEAAMYRFGGHAIVLNVGGDAWGLEHRERTIMDGDKAEHVKEAAPVLSRYCDVLAVRTFAQLRDAAEDAQDALLRAFALHATVPVINMESALEHPCQGLADWLTMEEKLPGGTAGRSFTLTWAPQAKAVPMAVPHSAILAAAAAGMHVTVAHPPGYELNPRIVEHVRTLCGLGGQRFSLTSEQVEACRSADVVYAKSWGAAGLYGQAEAQKASFRENADWMVDTHHLGPRTLLMHCLPVRRNVVISDAALDDGRCIVVDQAENRLWAQAAILARLLGR